MSSCRRGGTFQFLTIPRPEREATSLADHGGDNRAASFGRWTCPSINKKPRAPAVAKGSMAHVLDMPTDRPFLMIVTEKTTGAPLFPAMVSDPR